MLGLAEGAPTYNLGIKVSACVCLWDFKKHVKLKKKMLLLMWIMLINHTSREFSQKSFNYLKILDCNYEAFRENKIIIWYYKHVFQKPFFSCALIGWNSLVEIKSTTFLCCDLIAPPTSTGKQTCSSSNIPIIWKANRKIKPVWSFRLNPELISEAHKMSTQLLQTSCLAEASCRRRSKVVHNS